MSINLENTKKNKKETDPQEIRYRRRKDAIKNFAIVFLVIMLVLTFFSNTIMNYSLPQVAVQYMESGTITTTIRGTGTVESGDPYNVMVNESRTVSSITCRVGQEVRQGDLLFSLSGEDSDELETAKTELEAAQKAYDDLLLSESVTSAMVASSQGTVDVNSYRNNITKIQNEITEAENNLEKAKETFNALNNQLTIAQNSYSPSTAVNNAKATLDKAYADYQTAAAAWKVITDANEAKQSAYEAMQTANTTYTELDTAVSAKSTELTNAQSDYNNKYNDPAALPADVEEARIKVETLTAELSSLEAQKNDAFAAFNDATTTYTNAEVAYDTVAVNAASVKATYDSAALEYEKAQAAYEQASSNHSSNSTTNSDTVNSLNAQIATATVEVQKYEAIVTEKKNELSNLVNDIGIIRSLNEAHDKIADAQKKVDKLTTSTAAKDVTSPINGTILSVYIVSGKKTDPQNACVVIQPEGQSFTMSFTVSNDEAKTISIGANATVANSWWYNDVTGYVESIRPDTASPNTSKLVTLNLSGSLTSGQSLTMTIDSRTSNYDCIVPNSAIHEDNNGKFILVVESKSSPLGNRYFAVRYDVQVLASDDTKSAVKAGLEGYEYVVTTSSKPISAGDQVRLSEN